MGKEHIEKARKSREEYRSDVKLQERNLVKDTIFYSADLEKVIMLPTLNMFKQVVFTPRIVVFNQSFVPISKITKENKAYAVLWHEGISDRKKEVIVTAYDAFINYARDFKKIVIWADNCRVDWVRLKQKTVETTRVSRKLLVRR